MSSSPISVPQAHQLRQELLRVCDRAMLITLLQTLDIDLGDVGAWDINKLAHQLIQFAAQADKLSLLIHSVRELHPQFAADTVEHVLVQVGVAGQAVGKASVMRGVNPFVAGFALPAGSAVFVGRNRELFKVMSGLRASKPANVSVLGERRMGKSSLLRQVVGQLAGEDKVLVLDLCAHNWAGSVSSGAGLFAQWHASFAQGLQVAVQGEGFMGFCAFLREFAAQGYKFVLVLDEFECFLAQSFVDVNLLGQLRSLGDKAEFGFGYVLASRVSLSDLCHQHKMESSSFWNIFSITINLRLLGMPAVEQLLGEFWAVSKGEALLETEREKVLDSTGQQGFLLQCVLNQLWTDKAGGFAPDWWEYEWTVRQYYQDWWDRRSDSEKKILLQLVNEENVAESFVLDDLRLCGLVTERGQIFCVGFKRFLSNVEVKS